MNFLRKLFSGSPAGNERGFLAFTAKCDRCGERIAGRLNLNNDLSADYEGGSDIYFARKMLMGSGRCFQKIEIKFKFDADKRILEKQIRGGTFVESDDGR